MKALGDVLKLAFEYLKERDGKRARRDAEDLLASVLKVSRLDLYLQFDRPLEESELVLYRSYLKRKVQGEPVEYICGEVEFFKCRLMLSSDVLIPRPETEILLERACQQLASSSLKGKVAWDVCCGSGCLGLGLKKHFPELSLTLSDASQAAVQIAQTNSELNQLLVEVLHGDLLEPFQGRKADIVLCNPPYVSQAEFDVLDVSVKHFEPHSALLGGEDGLLFYHRLSQELPPLLNSGAKLFFEIGSGQGKAVMEIFDEPHWTVKSIEKDWAGHDRFFFLEFQ